MNTVDKFVFFISLVLGITCSFSAEAAVLNPITAVICNIIIVATGPAAQGVATVVLVVTGYSFFIGKASAGMLFVIVGGLVMVFGAESIMNLIAMGSSSPIECEVTQIVRN